MAPHITFVTNPSPTTQRRIRSRKACENCRQKKVGTMRLQFWQSAELIKLHLLRDGVHINLD